MQKKYEILDMYRRLRTLGNGNVIKIDAVSLRELCGLALVGIYAMDNGGLKDIVIGKIKNILDENVAIQPSVMPESEWRQGIIRQVIDRM